jgi:glycosyltransferase involved in cell wall biosynthesis
VISVWRLFQLFPSLHRSLLRSAVPLVFNLHDLWLPSHWEQSAVLAAAWERAGTGWIKQAVKLPIRLALRSADVDVTRPVAVRDLRIEHAVFCSRYRQEQHVHAGLGGRTSRVIYNGIDLGRFNGQPRRAHDGCLKLLFVGRLVEEKGLDTVIDALGSLDAQSNDISLTVVGIPSFPFEYRRSLEQRISRLGLRERIAIQPPVPNVDLPSIYRAHDALVFPSLGPEGFPITLLEAAACGLALVGTSTGGTGEFLEDGVTGLVFAPGNVEQLASCLERLRCEPQRAVELAERAQLRVRQEFDIERIVDQTERYLASVAA